MTEQQAREKIISVVLRRLGSERAEVFDAHYGDELDYCDDMLLEAATELVEAHKKSYFRGEEPSL